MADLLLTQSVLTTPGGAPAKKLRGCSSKFFEHPIFFFHACQWNTCSKLALSLVSPVNQAKNLFSLISLVISLLYFDQGGRSFGGRGPPCFGPRPPKISRPPLDYGPWLRNSPNWLGVKAVLGQTFLDTFFEIPWILEASRCLEAIRILTNFSIVKD